MSEQSYAVGDKVRIIGVHGKDCVTNAVVGSIGEITGGFDGLHYPIKCLRHSGEVKSGWVMTESIEKVVEEADAVMTQNQTFKVGDMVKAIANTADRYGEKDTVGWHVSGQGVVNVGAIGEVLSLDSGDFVTVQFESKDSEYIANRGESKLRLRKDEIELASPSPTKKQRLSTLEQQAKQQAQQIAELQAEVATLKSASKPPVTIIADAIARYNDKSPNEERKAIIAEAKAFVEAQKHKGAGKAPYRIYFEGTSGTYRGVAVEFHVNAKKRTVVVIASNAWDESEIQAKGIAKCAPDDVFNADIGKAIALGRALGLDVKRFEQAVKPTEFAKGQLTKTSLGGIYGITNVDKCASKAFTNPGTFHRTNTDEGVVILDDTDAQY